MNKFTMIFITAIITSGLAVNTVAGDKMTISDTIQNNDSNNSPISVYEISNVDSVITAKVKGVYGSEFSTIEIETKNGIVYLTGKLNTQVEIDRAILSAQSVSGVKNVESTLVVGEVPKK